jgi:hypothetical protein
MRLLHCCLLLTALLTLASCGARNASVPADSAFPAIGKLDSISRNVSDIATVNGVDYIASSGVPSAQPHPTQPSWLVLDGDAATGVSTWAIWRVSLTAGETPQFIDISLPQTYPNRYWLAYADFAAERWVFLDAAGNPLGRQGAPPSIQPTDPSVLLSPNLNMYVAILVMPTQKVNVAYLEANYSPVVFPDPIFDDFEDNDDLENCYELSGPGMYRASIHETPRDDMNDPNEREDSRDIYCVNVPAGSELTVTMRHDLLNYFSDFGEQELDLLYYPPGALDKYDDFSESLSSLNLRYYPFEQIHITSSGTQTFGVVAEVGDFYDDDAEYEMNVFISADTHEVSGIVKQGGQAATKKFVAFLTPGNFNDVTWFHEDEGLPESVGAFLIKGVPDGEYTLHVMGGAGFGEGEWIYDQTLPVSVAGGNVTDVLIDIEPYAGP